MIYSEWTLTSNWRDDLSRWMFSDGVSVHEELRNIEISKIRAVCDQQSRSRWTSIASRARLYQFFALSDGATQREMRQKVLSLIPMESGPSTALCYVPAFDTASPPVFSTLIGPSATKEDEHLLKASSSKPKTTKRYDPSPRTNEAVNDLLHWNRLGREVLMIH
jgi:hypothetical protein